MNYNSIISIDYTVPGYGTRVRYVNCTAHTWYRYAYIPRNMHKMGFFLPLVHFLLVRVLISLSIATLRYPTL